MNSTRRKLYRVVFEHDSIAGKKFDVYLLWIILASVAVVMIESVPAYSKNYKSFFLAVEWAFTIVFTIEYLLRIYISPRPLRYIFSFWGLIDLSSILPTYLSLFLFSYHYLIVVRIFRLLRVFRILKLARFSIESQMLINALKASSYKLGVFLLAIFSVVVFMGTIMYVVEGGEKGFTSIPQSIYWAIVTVTTVGYGDMVPHTDLGKFISSIAMIMGYAIIAVPTGILTVEMSKASLNKIQCTSCHHYNELFANFCINCGKKLEII